MKGREQSLSLMLLGWVIQEIAQALIAVQDSDPNERYISGSLTEEGKCDWLRRGRGTVAFALFFIAE